MTDLFFPAVIRPALFGFLVAFPDVPGLAVTADTIEKAREKAESALRRHLGEKLGRNEKLPEPSLLENLQVDVTAPEVARMLVKVELPEPRPNGPGVTRAFADRT
jgi:predicted RNase H-like HicB family nuclease